MTNWVPQESAEQVEQETLLDAYKNKLSDYVRWNVDHKMDIQRLQRERDNWMSEVDRRNQTVKTLRAQLEDISKDNDRKRDRIRELERDLEEADKEYEGRIYFDHQAAIEMGTVIRIALKDPKNVAAYENTLQRYVDILLQNAADIEKPEETYRGFDNFDPVPKTRDSRKD